RRRQGEKEDKSGHVRGKGNPGGIGRFLGRSRKRRGRQAFYLPRDQARPTSDPLQPGASQENQETARNKPIAFRAIPGCFAEDGVFLGTRRQHSASNGVPVYGRN